MQVERIRGLARLSSRDGSITVDAFCGSVLDATASGGDVDVVGHVPPDAADASDRARATSTRGFRPAGTPST